MKTTRIVPVDISLQEYVAIKINQYEHQSREFYFELYDNNARYIIPENAVARIKMRNSKGINMLYDCDIFNNMCHIIFDDMVSATSGKTKAQLVLTDNETGSILVTVPFYLYVVGSVYGEEVLSTQPYKSLEEALLRYDTDIAEIERHEETTEGYMQEASRNAGLAKSYAVGDEDARPGSSTDNAKYYKEQSKIFEKEIKDTVRTNLVNPIMKPKWHEVNGQPNFEHQEQTLNGITLATNRDGIFTVSGEATQNTTFKITETIHIPNPYYGSGNHEDEKYKFCGLPENIDRSKCNCRVSTRHRGTNTTSTYYDGEILLNVECFEVYLSVAAGAKINTYFRPMVTSDLDATYDDFVPYSGSGNLNENMVEIKSCMPDTASVSNYLTTIVNGMTMETDAGTLPHYYKAEFRVHKNNARTFTVTSQDGYKGWIIVTPTGGARCLWMGRKILDVSVIYNGGMIDNNIYVQTIYFKRNFHFDKLSRISITENFCSEDAKDNTITYSNSSQSEFESGRPAVEQIFVSEPDNTLKTTSKTIVNAINEVHAKSGIIVLHRKNDDLQNNSIVGNWYLNPETNQYYAHMVFGSYNVNFNVYNDYLEFVGVPDITFTSFVGITHILEGQTTIQRGMQNNTFNVKPSKLTLSFLLDNTASTKQYMQVYFDGTFYY